jgi:hypothetical protein
MKINMKMKKALACSSLIAGCLMSSVNLSAMMVWDFDPEGLSDQTAIVERDAKDIMVEFIGALYRPLAVGAPGFVDPIIGYGGTAAQPFMQYCLNNLVRMVYGGVEDFIERNQRAPTRDDVVLDVAVGTVGPLELLWGFMNAAGSAARADGTAVHAVHNTLGVSFDVNGFHLVLTEVLTIAAGGVPPVNNLALFLSQLSNRDFYTLSTHRVTVDGNRVWNVIIRINPAGGGGNGQAESDVFGADNGAGAIFGPGSDANIRLSLALGLCIGAQSTSGDVRDLTRVAQVGSRGYSLMASLLLILLFRGLKT